LPYLTASQNSNFPFNFAYYDSYVFVSVDSV
jgi:hypothetical protein